MRCLARACEDTQVRALQMCRCMHASVSAYVAKHVCVHMLVCDRCANSASYTCMCAQCHPLAHPPPPPTNAQNKQANTAQTSSRTHYTHSKHGSRWLSGRFLRAWGGCIRVSVRAYQERGVCQPCHQDPFRLCARPPRDRRLRHLRVCTGALSCSAQVRGDERRRRRWALRARRDGRTMH